MNKNFVKTAWPSKKTTLTKIGDNNMSVQTKKRFKNASGIIGILLFATIMFTNIKVALLSDEEIMKGDLNLLGYNIELFSPAAAETTSASCGDICTSRPNEICTYLLWNGYCIGRPI